MAATLLERPPLFGDAGAEPADMARRAATLSDVVTGAWEGLEAGALVACPVCDDLLVPVHHSHGRCRSCGSALS